MPLLMAGEQIEQKNKEIGGQVCRGEILPCSLVNGLEFGAMARHRIKNQWEVFGLMDGRREKSEKFIQAWTQRNPNVLEI